MGAYTSGALDMGTKMRGSSDGWKNTRCGLDLLGRRQGRKNKEEDRSSRSKDVGVTRQRSTGTKNVIEEKRAREGEGYSGAKRQRRTEKWEDGVGLA